MSSEAGSTAWDRGRFDARRGEVDTPSTWAVLSDDATLLARLRAEGWTAIPPPPASRGWHDDRWTVMHSLKLFGAR